MYIYIYIMFLNLLCILLGSIIFPKTVILHLEKIPGGITHTAVSFKTPCKTARYDFRVFNENNSCMTTYLDKMDFQRMYPNMYTKGFNTRLRFFLEWFFSKENKVIRYEIPVGKTYKTFEEIEQFSNKINSKYIFGIYDCRHYANRLIRWAGLDRIPIWNLKYYFLNENKVATNV